MKHSKPWRMSLLWSESVTGVVCVAASPLRESPSGVEVARNKQMAWLLMDPNTKWVFSSQELSLMLFLHFYSSCAHPKPHFQQQSSGTFPLMLRFRCKCFFTFYFVMSSSWGLHYIHLYLSPGSFQSNVLSLSSSPHHIHYLLLLFFLITFCRPDLLPSCATQITLLSASPCTFMRKMTEPLFFNLIPDIWSLIFLFLQLLGNIRTWQVKEL